MSLSSTLLKAKVLVPLTANVITIGSATYYLQSKINYNLEEQEARLDEIEGTLRGHIGLIEDALDRIEKKPNQNHQERLYSQRARDEKKGEQK
ncbi:hypothetical protein OPT61_g8183 [Boeremia exigua]|uniref:Uncharacterized protein n=1 Tax=Boeremia exigua TaxID=749465 RepID=A0ACC2I0Y1_9PLEO|nr:hypothetical protein OPT61_g8183 [Boeremia exigua]